MIVLPILALDATSFIMKFMMVLFVICAVVLVLVILVQKGKGGGLSGALGGGMAGGILGSKTGDFLTWLTIGLVGLFLILAVVLAKFYRPVVSDFGDEPAAQTTSVPAGQPLPIDGSGAIPGEVEN